jgi:hypothetical protein
MKVDTSALRAAITEEIIRQDKLAEKASKQILIEGKNAAHVLALHDTGFMGGDALEMGSNVTRIAPCIFEITLGSTADYAQHQEFGPKETTKKKWRFRPFIRPAVNIMQVKADEVIDRVFNE